MGTAPRLDAHDPLGGEGVGPGENELVLLGVDVVGDDVQVVGFSQAPAQGLDQGGLARADRPTDPHAQGPARRLRENGDGHDRNSLVYWASWAIEERSTMKPADPRSSTVAVSFRAPATSTGLSRAEMASCPSV